MAVIQCSSTGFIKYVLYMCVCIYIAVTAPAQYAGRSHDFVTLAAVLCQQLKSEQVFFLQVFIVEYHLASNSDLSRMNEFNDAFFNSIVPNKLALSHLVNHFPDTGSV